MRDYCELRMMRQTGISSRLCTDAQTYLHDHHWNDEPADSEHDRQLLKASQSAPDPLPLLCLRCRISHPLEAWLRATHARFQREYGLDLTAMACHALDDDGRLQLGSPGGERRPFTYAELAARRGQRLYPFSAEVLSSYDPARCGLPHWARLRLQAHNELKAYFKEQGLLLISDWALLRYSSSRRVRQACTLLPSAEASLEDLACLHGRYGALYDEAMATHKRNTGRASGWQPDALFLQALAPDQPATRTHAQLRAIAYAVRRLQSGRLTQSLEALQEKGIEPAAPRPAASFMDDDQEPAGASPAELRAQIAAALQRAMDQHLPQVLAAGRDQELLRCLWRGWAEGLTNRPLAARCGTSCGTVSKKLRPSEHAGTIAMAAALELRRHPAFASCSSSPEAAERLVEALRNHLLTPEQQGDVAPLRMWIQHALSQP